MAIQSRTIEEIEGAVGFGGRMALLISLLQDPKNLQKVVTELDKAKEVIAEKAQVIKDKLEAEKLIAAAEAIQVQAAQREAELDAKEEKITKAEKLAKEKKSELAVTARDIEKLQKQAEKDAAEAEKAKNNAMAAEAEAALLVATNKDLQAQLKAKIEGVNQRLEALKVA